MVFKTGNGFIQTGNRIIQTGNGIIYPIFRPLIKNLLLHSVSHFYRGLQNWFLKQEMELFLPLPVLWSKNFFNKNVLIFTQEFKIDFQNRKQNYLNRKRNYLSHFRASDQKTSFTRCFTFFPRSLRLIFKTGNGIISPTFRLMIK